MLSYKIIDAHVPDGNHSDIAEAGVSEQYGIGKINDAVSHMDTAMQQNATLVEEPAATSALLHEQASKLAQVVSIFKLSKAEVRAAGAAPRTLARAPQPKQAARTRIGATT